MSLFTHCPWGTWGGAVNKNFLSAFCNFINTQLSLGPGSCPGPGPGAALADPIDVCALNFATAVCLDGFCPRAVAQWGKELY